ncbi:NACHT domain protein [Caballeronia udeis]|uniref:NACHT domain protein n=1 Tax=Caballeronia udeis TaxID=1232866 RepID=A0A158JVH0_9BURK|nr:NACHT domain-containing protein [Caballeronia udeis]SAL72411.1 NACHT domain protein [Caballeronia udeis]
MDNERPTAEQEARNDVSREDIDPLLDAELNGPVDGIPSHPPVTTRVQVLPFGALTWENFERLCYRLAGKAQRVEHVARYGRPGQAQQGIDLFVRGTNAKYEVWQVKRYESVTATDVAAMVSKFRAGAWKDKSEKLILAVQASLADTKVQDGIEEQAAALKAVGVTLVPHGGEELSELLRSNPDIVDDFFGRQWVEAFLGPDIAKALGSRLDGGEFARVRAQLYKYYDAHFHLLDVGVALPLKMEGADYGAPPSLLQRFIVPDVVVRDTVAGDTPATQEPSGLGGRPADSETAPRQTKASRRNYVRRSPLGTWLAEGQHLAVIGDSGSGKSVLLRCIALDLLSEKQIFPQIAHRWGGLLPLHISFSRWSRLSAARGRPAGLKDVIAETLQPALTTDLLSLMDRAVDERRCLLLIDGLDEWSEEQAARTTLQQIMAFVATHNVPTIMTARPRGLEEIGSIPPEWRTAELAPLSLEQQRALARVWFSKALPSRVAGDGLRLGDRMPIDARLDRFFMELTRDRRLFSLAGNPLLLVGLVALSLRQVALPRNRLQALQSLVAILLETHPEGRATAAGDTTTRFIHIPDTDDRRAALARLAFVSRSENGGGTYNIRSARKTIREYLADPDAFAYSTDRAQNAASEMLAVNAETVGLVSERAPGEIGFAHAAFEEYLAAEHIQTWSLQDMLDFVRVTSGDTLWRNVISNLVCLLKRPTEVESVVSTIETAQREEASIEGAIGRDVLLADIAFNAARKHPATARRLMDRAFDIIETGDWMLARREVLKAALTNAGETPSPIDDRLSSWLPRRERYLRNVFAVLGDWNPAADLQEALMRGVHDEEPANQRSAAQALSRVYRGDDQVRERLRELARSTLDLSVAAASLGALTNGWPETPGLSDLHDAALESRFPMLRFTGAMGRITSGRADGRDRDCLMDLLSEFSDIDYWERPAAWTTLAQKWPDDVTIIDAALNSLGRQGGRRRQLDREPATHYLLRCSPTNTRVTNWVRYEVKQEHPFILTHDDLIWDRVAVFAAEHDDIRASVITLVRSDYGRYNLHSMQGLLVKLHGNELRDELIHIARTEDWMPYWAVAPLIEGWGRSDPVVAAFMDEIAAWDDDKLQGLAALLPQILPDFDLCRARLLGLTRAPGRKRFDFITRGLAILGCTAKDTEVINTLLAGINRGVPAFDPGQVLIEHFHASPRVREYALQTMKDRSPPIPTLARVYENDQEIRALVLAFARPLPAQLRGDIIEAASAEASSRPAFGRALEDYDIEVDSELKITASIYYHRNIIRAVAGTSSDHLSRLRGDLLAVGPDLNERRAAAFAGMVVLGHVDDVTSMTEHEGKPLTIRPGALREESESLAALMCERWDEVLKAFGSSFPARFGNFRANDGRLWDFLAPHINASPAARRDFLSFCASTETVLSLRSFIALAREQPSSELLLEHCCRVFLPDLRGAEVSYSPWDIERVRLEVAYIIRDHFPTRRQVREQLREAFARGRRHVIVALLLLGPGDPLFERIPHGPKDIIEHYRDWVVAVHLAAARSGADEFVEVVYAMVNRGEHGIWDFQEITNRAVIERLQRDADVVQRFKTKLACGPSECEIASLPRYLMAAGAMGTDVVQQCRSLLGDERRRLLPKAGYDAIDDSTRAVSVSLLEILAPSLSP